jgi:hypothetical protein
VAKKVNIQISLISISSAIIILLSVLSEYFFHSPSNMIIPIILSIAIIVIGVIIILLGTNILKQTKKQ